MAIMLVGAFILIVILAVPRWGTRWHQWHYGGFEIEEPTEYEACPVCGLKVPAEFYADHAAQRHT